MLRCVCLTLLTCCALIASTGRAEDSREGAVFFEKHIRPLLAARCYECHSEEGKQQQGGLLLDRRSGWLKGGDTDKAVVPGQPEASLLIEAIRYQNEDLQMPPEEPLAEEEVALLERWVKLGAPGPATDLGDTEFSRLGDQELYFEQAQQHWSFQPIAAADPPAATHPGWNEHAIDRFIFARQSEIGASPSAAAAPDVLLTRLSYDLTGLPPTPEAVAQFAAAAKENQATAVESVVDTLLESPDYGTHFARLWLDVARYADTDSFYRPDTRTPHYFPFAFTYRDYVVESFNNDLPYDQFLREQLAADLMEPPGPPQALGFLAVGPHASRNQAESIDDFIDVTSRGLLGLTVACARCHDHKYEPIPTADYYALRGVFASTDRLKPLDEKGLPLIPGYEPSEADLADYQQQRAAIDKRIKEAGGKKSKGNNRSVAQKIRETDLAELLLFHPGAPARAMVVQDVKKPADSYIFPRGQVTRRGETVPRRFLKVLDPEQPAFDSASSGRLDLANKIASPENPLTARVIVNRVWGALLGRHIVGTPSDFGLQGERPTHPALLDWLAADFMEHGWSIKHLVRRIVLSRTYQQRSHEVAAMAKVDPDNQTYWRANRKHLSIEALRDGMLAVSGQLDHTPRGRAGQLWGESYSHRRSIYGYINRFNLDPTLRVFDFPTPMQTQPNREESVVAPQALFTMNAPFVIDQAVALTEQERFTQADSDEARTAALFVAVLQRQPHPAETTRVLKVVEQQSRFFTAPKPKARIRTVWPLIAQSLLMSNEFQYVD